MQMSPCSYIHKRRCGPLCVACHFIAVCKNGVCALGELQTKEEPCPPSVDKWNGENKNGGREDGWLSDVCWLSVSRAIPCAEQPAITGETITCGLKHPTSVPQQKHIQLPYPTTSWGLIYKHCIHTEKVLEISICHSSGKCQALAKPIW